MTDGQQLGRKTVPAEQRRAARAELQALKDELYAKRAPCSQAAIGALLGGLSQTAIGKAMNHADLGSDVLEAILKYRGMTVQELLAKHRETGTVPATALSAPAPIDSLSTPEAAQIQEEYLPQVDASWREKALQALRASEASASLSRVPLEMRWEFIVAYKPPSLPVRGLDILLAMRRAFVDPPSGDERLLGLHEPESGGRRSLEGGNPSLDEQLQEFRDRAATIGVRQKRKKAK